MKIRDDLYCFDGTIRMPLGNFPVRSTFVRTSKGNVLISPTPDLEEHAALMTSLGGVQYLVAPSLIHHKYFADAVRLFPAAERWGVAGFETKRPDIQWQKFFDRDEWPLENELDAYVLDGVPDLNETVFIHAASQTLIATDLIFNVGKPGNLFAKLMLTMLGTYGRFAVSRYWKKQIKDPTAFGVSMALVMDAEFDRVIMAHGKILETGGKHQMREALSARGL